MEKVCKINNFWILALTCLAMYMVSVQGLDVPDMNICDATTLPDNIIFVNASTNADCGCTVTRNQEALGLIKLTCPTGVQWTWKVFVGDCLQQEELHCGDQYDSVDNLLTPVKFLASPSDGSTTTEGVKLLVQWSGAADVISTTCGQDSTNYMPDPNACTVPPTVPTTTTPTTTTTTGTTTTPTTTTTGTTTTGTTTTGTTITGTTTTTASGVTVKTTTTASDGDGAGDGDDGDDIDYKLLVGVVVGGVALLLLVIIIAIICCVRDSPVVTYNRKLENAERMSHYMSTLPGTMPQFPAQALPPSRAFGSPKNMHSTAAFFQATDKRDLVHPFHNTMRSGRSARSQGVYSNRSYKNKIYETMSQSVPPYSYSNQINREWE